MGANPKTQPYHPNINDKIAQRIFGRSLIPSIARRPAHRLRFKRCLREARGQARANIPICPGVYGWINADGALIYIGKSKSLRHRLTGYFATETSDPKMAKIRNQSSSLVWEPISHEMIALVREQELISRLRPPLNVEGKPERRQPGFVCLSRGLAPRAFFARQIPTRAAHAFGPIGGRARLSEAIVSLNYVFQLRDCPDKTRMQFNNQLQLFEVDANAQCMRYELGTCPAPCAGHCSRQSYLAQVDRLCGFLSGDDQTTIAQIKNQMSRAAGQLAFERASVLRDQLHDLEWLARRINQLNQARRRLDGILSLPGFDHRQQWIVFRRGLLRACLERPLNAADQICVATTIKNLVVSDEDLLPKSDLEINLLMLFSTWFKKHPEQFASILGFEEFQVQLHGTTIHKRVCA